MNHFYLASYMIFKNKELIKSGIYLRASEVELDIRQLHKMITAFCGKGLSAIEVLLNNVQKITEADYNSFLPGGMSSSISPEFDSYYGN